MSLTLLAKNLMMFIKCKAICTPRDRLFQMELSTRPASGRLSQLLGPKLFKYDKFFVKMGMRRSVDNAYNMIMADAEVRSSLEAYTEGVNRHVRGLSSSKYPIEYKLLGATPELWTAKKSVGLLKVMTFRLAGRSYDLMVTKHLQNLGLDKTLSLFPPSSEKRWFAGYEDGKGYEGAEFRKTASSNFKAQFLMFPEYLQPFATNGSNNWAVSAKASGDGNTYVANDTHLKYSSPAIWYEQQLIATEDNVNMYGAAFAGAPSLEIGTSPQFGWAVTNGNTDVADWYEVEFENSESLKYKWNGKWEQAERVLEEIEIKGQRAKMVDLIYTKAGLVMAREGNLGLAFRWLPHSESNEFKAFLNLVKSKNRNDCEKAVQHLWSPSQNVICADNEGVALYHAGKIPIRPYGDGQFVKDGRVSETQWKGFVPFENIPKNVDPEEGFVFSANAPVASEKYPYFVSWDFNPPHRALRIREVLKRQLGEVSIESFMKLQTDVFDITASEALPLMLKYLQANETAEVLALKGWGFEARADSAEASIFYLWRQNLRKALYQPSLGVREGNLYPKDMILTEILEAVDQSSEHPALWLLGANPKQALKQALKTSFADSLQYLRTTYGPDPKNWGWGSVQGTQIDHLIKIKPFGGDLKRMGGSEDTVNANAGNHGPSWRHIARLGESFELLVNYPGGQPGNPFDPNYRGFVEDWSEGVYRKAVYFDSAEEALNFYLPKKEGMK
jgi:penicillin amidase